MKHNIFIYAMVILIVSTNTYSPADIVYFNGNFLTMASSNRPVGFVAISGGKIVEVGATIYQIIAYVGTSTTFVNLRGMTLMPGFIDAHSHFVSTVTQYTQGFDISSPPLGNISSISQILTNLKKYITDNSISTSATIFGAGYNNLELTDQRHPNRYDLDSVSTTNPIILRHVSGHILVANSAAMAGSGFTDANLSSPATGFIVYKFANGTNTGLFAEQATVPILTVYMPIMLKMSPTAISRTVQLYASTGFTTAHDLELNIYDSMGYGAQGNSFPFDVNTFFWYSSNAASLYTSYASALTYQNNRHKLRGVKIMMDGSIQCYTGLLSQPYWVSQANFYSDLTNYVYDTSRSCSNSG